MYFVNKVLGWNVFFFIANWRISKLVPFVLMVISPLKVFTFVISTVELFCDVQKYTKLPFYWNRFSVFLDTLSISTDTKGDLNTLLMYFFSFNCHLKACLNSKFQSFWVSVCCTLVTGYSFHHFWAEQTESKENCHLKVRLLRESMWGSEKTKSYSVGWLSL